MYKKRMILLVVATILITGCSKQKDSEKSYSKAASSDIIAELVGIAKKLDFDELKKEIENKDLEATKDLDSDKSNESDKVITNETSIKEKETTNQNVSQSETKSSINDQQPTQNQPESGKNDQPQQEQSKPVEPKPLEPVCKNDMPSNAWLNEDEAAAYAEKLLLDNMLNGDGSLNGYSIEVGETGCGTKYYILEIY